MAHSALIGEPAATMEDYWICRGLLQAIGMPQGDPWKGVPIPPAKPPPGQYRKESRVSNNLAAYSIAIAIMCLITLSRLYLRAFSKRMRWGLDDWLMIVAFLLALAWPIVGICKVIYGRSGHHVYDITYHQYRMSRLLGYSQQTIFYLAIAWIKMSIIAFNMRLTGLTSRRWMIVHWTFFGAMVLFALLSLFFNIFITDPPRAGFDLVYAGHLDAPPRTTMNIWGVSYTLIVIHIVSDVVLLSFFGIVLWKLQMSWVVKVRLMMVFAVGAISFIAAIKWELAQKTLTTDSTWNTSNQLGWTLTDLTAGQTVASLPILSSLFVQAFNSIKSSLLSLSGISSRAGTSGQQHVFSDLTPSRPRRWPGQTLLSRGMDSSESQPIASDCGAETSIYADTPGWERPLGHVEEKERWSTRETARHQKEGYEL